MIFIVDIDHEPVQICTLYGCENVKSYYYLVGYDVVNITTGKTKALCKLNTKRGYPYVTLETVDSTANKKCLMHHLIALAYIKNEPYEVIEHLDDDPMNYSLDNLKFSTQKKNIQRAFENGHSNREEKIFNVAMKNGESHIGTIKELQTKLNIPRQTLYCRFYNQTPGRKIRSVTEVKSTEYRTGTDR